MSPELLELIGGSTPVDELDLESLAKSIRELDNDPSFVSDKLKGAFISEIFNGMHETGINASQLAKKWGKTRQYVSKLLKEDKRVNFTIDTVVEVMMLLDRRVELHFPKKNETTMVLKCLRDEPVRTRDATRKGKVEPEKIWEFKGDVRKDPAYAELAHDVPEELRCLSA